MIIMLSILVPSKYRMKAKSSSQFLSTSASQSEISGFNPRFVYRPSWQKSFTAPAQSLRDESQINQFPSTSFSIYYSLITVTFDVL